MPTQNKFLVQFVHSADHRTLFFAFWFAIVAFFSYLMYAHYQKTQQRNFKNEREQVRAKSSKAVVKREDNLPKT